MSQEFTLDATKVTAFAKNIMLRPQQLQSRLVPFVDAQLESAEPGDSWTADYLGEDEPQEVRETAGNTPDGFLDEFRRTAYWAEYESAKWIDKAIILDKLADPTSPTIRNMLFGKERSRDRVIMNSFFADVKEGRNGATTVVWNTANDIAVNDWTFYRGKTDGGVSAPTGNSGLTPSKLRKAAAMLDDAECVGIRSIAVTSIDLQNLLTSIETTSSDYNAAQALYDGKITEFMGFKFHRLPQKLFNISGGIADLPVWISDAMEYRARTIVPAQVWTRNDRRGMKQAYYMFEQSGLRKVDAGVLRIKTLQS